MSVEAFKQMNAAYDRRTEAIWTLVREVEAAAGQLTSEWPFVEIRSMLRRSNEARAGRRTERWPDGTGIERQIERWNAARENVLRLWSALSDSEREGLEPPWAPSPTMKPLPEHQW